MKRTLPFFLILMTVMLCAAPAGASMREEIAQTLSAEDRDLLLRDEAAFFDKAERKGVTMSNGTVLQLFGQWILKRQKSPAGGARHVFLEHMREDGKPVSLTIRCVNNTTSMLLGAGQTFAGPTSSVEYVIDKGKAVTVAATVSQQGGHLFLPKPVGILRAMVGKKTLTVRLQPESGEMIEEVLDIEGVEQVLEPVSKACNWKLKK